MKETCNTSKEQISCSITDSGCKTSNSKENLAEYWCGKYTDIDYKKLGWYEKESTPSIQLINETNLDKNSIIFNAGAGSTTLIDNLLKQGYTNLIANDISSCALNNIKKRIGKKQDLVQFFTDDLINPTILNDLPKIDIWNDRAVLHFFTDEKDQKAYLRLLKNKVAKNGFVILAEFALNGAKKCSGLEVKPYDEKMLQEFLGKDFNLIKYFNHLYVMPNGDERSYIYTLFQRVN